jgi:hypothetical protein
VWFLGIPGANFDLASFSFQVPICGLAKQTAVAAKQSARLNPIVFVFILPHLMGGRRQRAIYFFPHGFSVPIIGAICKMG